MMWTADFPRRRKQGGGAADPPLLIWCMRRYPRLLGRQYRHLLEPGKLPEPL